MLVSAWCLPIESLAALRQHNAAVLSVAADAYIFDSPDDEETTVLQRFSRKAFVQQSLQKLLSVLAHIGAFRLPAESRLFTSDPAAKDLPFNPLWLTLPGLVSMAWCVNVLNTSVKNNQVTSYLLDRHQIARAMDPIEGAFFPAFVPAFFHNTTIMQAIRSGNFTSGHRLLAMDQLSDSLTPFHFIASVNDKGEVIIPSLGLSAISTVTILQNLGWLLHCIFCGPSALPSSFSGHISVHVSSPVCGSPHASDPMLGPTAYHRGLGFERSRKPDTWSPKLVRFPLPCGTVV